MAKLYDLSPPISADTPVWPGDTPFSYRLTCKLAAGDSVNLSALTTTPHLGSHADAPFHTETDGTGIGAVPLTPYLGPCRVIDVTADDGTPPSLLEVRHLGDADPADPPRLLFKTGSVTDPATFPQRFTALSPRLAERLVTAGTLLVGLDTPSVDPFTSTRLEAHHVLFRGGVANLEGLALDGVPAGVYELIALPLRLTALDASPVRAVLRTLDGTER